MSRNILNKNPSVYINNIQGGESIQLTSNNSSITDVNLKISKQTAQSTLADDDVMVLETSSGDIRKVSGQTIKQVAHGLWTEANGNI